jgi:hypothetical protein
MDDDENESDTEMLADLDDQDIDEDKEGTDQDNFDSELLDEIEGEVNHNEFK